MGDSHPVRIGYLEILDHLILGVTAHRLQNGEAGLHHSALETVAMTAWDQVMDGLLDSTLDGAFILLPAAIDLFARGTGHRLLMLAHRGGSAVVINRHSRIKTLSDFCGKAFLVPHRFSMHHILVHQLLTSSGLKIGWVYDPQADVILDAMPPCLMPEALALDSEGEIAGFAVAEPFGNKAVQEGSGTLFCRSDRLWPGHPCCVFILHEDVILGRPEAVEELIRELVVSGRDIDQRKGYVFDAGQQFLGQGRHILTDLLPDRQSGYSTLNLTPTAAELETIQTYMIQDLGLLTRRLDLEGWVDPRFARNAGA